MNTSVQAALRGPFGFIDAGFAAVSTYVGSLALMIACARRAQYLLGLSDDALARRGLERSEVVQHALAPYFSA